MQNELNLPTQHAQFYALNDDEVDQVSGGVAWIGVAAYVAALNGAHTLGESIGRAIYNVTH
jgi:hypothetical protein